MRPQPAQRPKRSSGKVTTSLASLARHTGQRSKKEVRGRELNSIDLEGDGERTELLAGARVQQPCLQGDLALRPPCLLEVEEALARARALQRALAESQAHHVRARNALGRVLRPAQVAGGR